VRGLSNSRFPGLAAGVPADEAVTGDENGDALEECAVFLGRVVDCEFGDRVDREMRSEAAPLAQIKRGGLVRFASEGWGVV